MQRDIIDEYGEHFHEEIEELEKCLLGSWTQQYLPSTIGLF